jgi:hypothetical protein
MIGIISHAWLLDGEEHLRAYVSISSRFEAVHRQSGGYRGRRLVRDQDDPKHLINMRWFESVADYERLVARPEYPDWIAQLSKHVMALNPQKAVVDVLLDTTGLDGIGVEGIGGEGIGVEGIGVEGIGVEGIEVEGIGVDG